ncbi:D-glycero-beta-D-manno-heptose 1,7-bisphosphate 7-phosphatase [Psychromonas sp. 14N.309.X.WAT.B.A12]|jgi:D-glycero-D-manno-heptose 1,7-bisphosphate phosphatase|uniref:D-glycero-beta-D-manno-heptose 1,7-bisphosphate 7-phosphatase n=1 Tax=unclassified Psychromonas TaxID=2614957 RepID=UPI0025B14CFF|nr:D-glycero-beta-D-manno-heptose 1,7-bisphosphate 7-phosphatase [Psychromonas sp. 14N.309.X.WAT.B.A12]MDN2663288.1 D-glycero-beta-D-manno-heptose 1,7-bisphosphate 7-phosphatase [Psychromonas sp. 14N.309.X.WAT.B.A12]
MSKSKPAVFLDRDGVINKDNGYVSEIDDFEFLEGAIEACIALKKKGYLLVVVTNQSGIARGYFSEEQFHTLTEWMDWSMADRGVDLDGIYYCPHHSEAGIGEFKIDCECRKPKPGMLSNAIDDLSIDVENSILVGDKVSDIQAGIAAGVKTNYLVRTGKAITEEGETLATAIFDDLTAVVESI